MHPRILAKPLKALAKQYPVITLLGPRQSGKTTLVKQCFPDYAYINLEEPDTRLFAKEDPRRFLESYSGHLIVDEIQRVPELLSYIQVMVDSQPEKGRFILTGSHQFELHQSITQSLAGRTALLTLLPFSLAELQAAGENISLDQALFKGFYPRIYQNKLNPTQAYRDYFKTYVERDVRQLINIKDLSLFEKFIHLCAGRVGTTLNINQLGNDTGISTPTVEQWLSLLEASFIIYKLRPYYENFGKRVIKASKLYFTDVGLLSYLLGIEDIKQLFRDPLRGNCVENLVVMELVKARLNYNLDPHFYYFRDNHQHEIDVIFKQGSQLIPIEIKASQTFNIDFLKGLRYFEKLAADRVSESYLIYAGDQERTIENIHVRNFKHAHLIVERGIYA